MSFLQCPLCGRHVKLSSFDATKFEDDIYIRQSHGLGRGRGFEWDPPLSVLGDDSVTPLVAERTPNLLGILVKSQSISGEKSWKG